MRIVQLIDSLEAGGAERMAVNYANALANEIEFSGLVSTRKQGALLDQIDSNVSYLFLNKKRKLDLGALFRLRSFVLKNSVSHLQAHSSSFFLAVLVKLSLPKIKIIWHDHYGNSDFLKNRSKRLLQLTSLFFCGIITVNGKLKTWALEQLHCKNIIYLTNFAVVEKEQNIQTFLKGQSGKRIVCLANLRPQKNHFLLLEVALKLKKTNPDWTFHLVGKDFEDDYSNQIKKLIREYDLENNVFLYGSKQDIENILNQASIAILTSKSEGLPVALLEYGLYKKAVLLTNVGQVASIVENGIDGFLVTSNNPDEFYEQLVKLIEDKVLQQHFAQKLNQKVIAHFSAASVMKQYLHWIRTTIINE
ncbi:MAG: glycosyltransferase [Flavobacterium sp.]